jgi:NitT/TauT family transport system substrate-binding protein
MRIRRMPAFALAVAVVLAACSGSSSSSGDTGNLTKVKFVLPWVVQGESAGHFVAVDKGFYKEAGLDVEIIPGGPDVNAAKLLASGSADFATGSSGGIILARKEGIPLVALWTQNQESGSGLVCKTKTGVKEWKDLKDKKVGIWVGLGEPELYYAVEKAGVSHEDVQWLPQKFSMVEFYEDKFDCASVTFWNELHVVEGAGYAPGTDFNLLKASDLGIYLSGDSGMTTEKMVKEKPEIVQAFVNASLRGWKWALDHPDDAVAATMRIAPDLDPKKQLFQVEEVNRLMISGPAEKAARIGTVSPENFAAYQDALIGAGQLDAPQDLSGAINTTFLDKVPKEYVSIDNRDAILKRIETSLGS